MLTIHIFIDHTVHRIVFLLASVYYKFEDLHLQKISAQEGRRVSWGGGDGVTAAI